MRATGILVEGGCILLVKQQLHEQTHWNLPGGGMEADESLGQCLTREFAEETGVLVRRGDLLYLCDRKKSLGNHVLDISFLVSRISGDVTCAYTTNETITDVQMVPIRALQDYGFDRRFVDLAQAGFPNRGTYQGDFHAFYG